MKRKLAGNSGAGFASPRLPQTEGLRPQRRCVIWSGQFHARRFAQTSAMPQRRLLCNWICERVCGTPQSRVGYGRSGLE